MIGTVMKSELNCGVTDSNCPDKVKLKAALYYLSRICQIYHVFGGKC